MNIAFLIKSLTTAGGTERVTVTLANVLSEKGYHVSIITLFKGDPFFSIAKSVSTFTLNDVKQGSIYATQIKNILTLHKLLKREKIDICIDVCSAMSLISIPAKTFTKAKIITWEHFNANIDWNKITTPLSRKLASLFAKKIVVLTHTDKSIYEKRYNAHNVVCIHNPITLDNQGLASQLTEKRAIAIGRLEDQKGFDLLLKAWGMCNCKDRGWTLDVVGDGSKKESLTKQLNEEGLQNSVKILPPTKNVLDLYLNASLYVMSSRFEGLPLVLIEAMSVGLPIISFDCHTGPRDIVQNGVTGVLVEDGNITKLSEAIDSLTSDNNILHTMGENAIKYSKLFDIEPIKQQWINLIEHL